LPSSVKAPAQSSWAELASSIASVTSVIAYVTSSIAFGTPIWNISEIAVNQPNLLCNICRSTQVKLKMILEIFIRWKTTSMEDDLSGR
jgi:hypothetical protein